MTLSGFMRADRSHVPGGPVVPVVAELDPSCLKEGPLAMQARLETIWGGIPLRWAIVALDDMTCRVEGAVWRERHP